MIISWKNDRLIADISRMLTSSSFALFSIIDDHPSCGIFQEVNVDVEGQTEPPPPYHTEGGAGGPGYGTTENAPPSYDDAGDPTGS